MMYLLDTDTIIDILRGRIPPDQYERLIVEQPLACSVVSVAEVYYGMRPDERDRTIGFLDSLERIAVSTSIATLAGSLGSSWRGRGRTLLIPDLLIAATALEHGMTLVTRNVKDYPMEKIRITSL